MNAVGSLNLATHDEGVAAISNFQMALDWLAIAFPAPVATSLAAFQQHHHHHPQHPHQQHPSPPAPHHPQPHPHPLAAAPPLSAADPITSNQANAALVRRIHPYSAREVLAPCFRVAGRFVLGRVLGNLHVPTELGLPHLAAEPHADARFVLDLHHASIVEVRHYPSSKALLCVAYASRRAEFLSLPPAHYARVEITYRRDHSANPIHPDFGHLFEHVPRSQLAQTSWPDFCTNYTSTFPTGPLTATVTSEPGPATATFKKEAITVAVNDQFAMTFSHSHSSRPGASQARRIAPKRLLPRPTP